MTDEEQQVSHKTVKAITTNTTITIGSAVAIVMVIGGFIFKAGQTLTEFDYVKARVIIIEGQLNNLDAKLTQLLTR